MSRYVAYPGRMENANQSIRRIREAKGLTQSDLAELAQISRQALHKIESGAGLPSLPAALRLASTLETTVEELFGQNINTLKQSHTNTDYEVRSFDIQIQEMKQLRDLGLQGWEVIGIKDLNFVAQRETDISSQRVFQYRKELNVSVKRRKNDQSGWKEFAKIGPFSYQIQEVV